VSLSQSEKINNIGQESDGGEDNKVTLLFSPDTKDLKLYGTRAVDESVAC